MKLPCVKSGVSTAMRRPIARPAIAAFCAAARELEALDGWLFPWSLANRIAKACPIAPDRRACTT